MIIFAFLYNLNDNYDKLFKDLQFFFSLHFKSLKNFMDHFNLINNFILLNHVHLSFVSYF